MCKLDDKIKWYKLPKDVNEGKKKYCTSCRYRVGVCVFIKVTNSQERNKECGTCETDHTYALMTFDTIAQFHGGKFQNTNVFL